MKKTALITGASRGIGAQCARVLARDGFRVIINYNKSELEARSLADEIGALAIHADVSDPSQVEDMFAQAGGVDVLICNAGVPLYSLFTDTSCEDWRRIFSVNLDGVFNCCRLAAPHMIKNKSGRIVTVSSMWGITGASCESAYSASKAAVIGLTKSLAKELGPSGICVNCVAPGVIDTDMNSNLSEEDVSSLRNLSALGRIGTPGDVAEVVSFLVSEKAGFITGQVISVDGGFIM